MSNTDEIAVEALPPDAAILDVREDDEWNAGHIKGATHVPVAEVPQRLDEVPEADSVYVICRSGGRSLRVADWLNDNGFTAVNVIGGMRAWKQAGKPMFSENGTAPEVI